MKPDELEQLANLLDGKATELQATVCLRIAALLEKLLPHKDIISPENYPKLIRELAAVIHPGIGLPPDPDRTN